MFYMVSAVVSLKDIHNCNMNMWNVLIGRESLESIFDICQVSGIQALQICK